MTDAQWHVFFISAANVLGGENPTAKHSLSRCSWTTFDRLQSDAGYWTGGVPSLDDIWESSIADGGAWGQPFLFSQLAHVIIPRQFEWEDTSGPDWTTVTRRQDLEAFSAMLSKLDVPHRVTELVLEVKCF